MEDDQTETPLGWMNLHDIHTKHSRADIDDQTEFTIGDQDAFARFTETMITSQNFTWKLTSDNLHVHALKFPTAKGIKFRKYVTLDGKTRISSRSFRAVLIRDQGFTASMVACPFWTFGFLVIIQTVESILLRLTSWRTEGIVSLGHLFLEAKI